MKTVPEPRPKLFKSMKSRTAERQGIHTYTTHDAIKELLVEPALDIITTWPNTTKYYNKSLKRGFRSQGDTIRTDIANTLEKENPGDTAHFGPWFQLSNPNRTSANEERRLYVPVTDEQLVPLTRKVYDEGKHMPHFRKLKINEGDTARLDNLLLYFSEDIQKDELSAMVRLINKEGKDSFNNYTISSPWQINYYNDNRTTAILSHFPIRSSTGNLHFEGTDGKRKSALTPNDLWEVCVNHIKTLYDKGIRDPKEITTHLEQAQITMKDKSIYHSQPFEEYVAGARKELKKVM